jgi:hypothetical protein
MIVYVVIEEWSGNKRRKKVEDAKIIGIYTKLHTAVARADRLRSAGRRMKLKEYVVRIEDWPVEEG